MSDPITKREAEEIAKTAAAEAVHEFARLLGVDTFDQRSMNEFRADLISIRQSRKLKEMVGNRAWLVFLTAAMVWAATTFWDGIKIKLGLG